MSTCHDISKIAKLAIVSMPNLTFAFITHDRDIGCSTNYSYYYLHGPFEQFDTIFKKIGATLFLYLCTNLEFTFDLQLALTREQ